MYVTQVKEQKVNALKAAVQKRAIYPLILSQIPT